MPVIKYPEITKKISTPMYPPEKKGTLIWLKMTSKTASARSPSKNGMYLIFNLRPPLQALY
jgi:hypothetical protein